MSQKNKAEWLAVFPDAYRNYSILDTTICIWSFVLPTDLLLGLKECCFDVFLIHLSNLTLVHFNSVAPVRTKYSPLLKILFGWKECEIAFYSLLVWQLRKALSTGALLKGATLGHNIVLVIQLVMRKIRISETSIRWLLRKVVTLIAFQGGRRTGGAI